MTGRHRNPPQRHLDLYGCSKEQWIELRDIGIAMVEAGGSADATPLRAYQHQRFASLSRRKIEWKLTLVQWWQIWQDSGHWDKRGLGRGYMMCRKGDAGAYEVGNVYIGPGAENLSAAAKKTDLPIGVAYTTKSKVKPFRAYCNFQGKQRHLGVFSTADEASAAYLAVRKLDELLARAAA